MPESNEARAFQAAEREFYAFRDRVGAGESLDFDAYCADRPELAEMLRVLHSAYAIERSAPTGSLRELLASRYGEQAGEWLNFGPDEDSSEAGVAPRPGESVDPAGRYILKGEIGRGGTSRILAVWDRDLGRRVAMKVSLERTTAEAGRAQRSAALERLLGEAHVTARLDHPGIVPIHDVGVDREGRPYFTMLLVRGRDFGQVIDLARQGKEGWTVPRAVECIWRVCQTVAFAHAKGVVHRDLKPSNVMVGSFGETYVMDWGLAKIANTKDRHAVRLHFAPEMPLSTVQSRGTGEPSDDPLDPLVTPAGTVVGTPAFMPPEQAQGKVELVNPTSDVYALGAMLYTLLAGRPPYVSANGRGSTLAILSKVVEGPPLPILEVNPAVPRALAAICEKAMSRLQENRYRDSLELAMALESASARRFGSVDDGKGAPAGLARGFKLAAALLIVGVVCFASFLIGRGAGGGAREEAVLADLQRISQLEEESEALWPAVSANVGAMRAWLDRAAFVSAHAPAHEQALAAISSTLSGDDRRHDADADLRRLVERLRAFASRDGPGGQRGTIARVERGLEFALQSRKWTIDEAWQRWQEACAGIANKSRCPFYEGLELAPQEGLIPLGPDPDSGLWEFGHLQTGRVPLRATDGKLGIGADSGMILVLVPPGPAMEPFFLARHELTQAQWERAMGPGDGARKLQWLGMSLPTGAEWSHAASRLANVGPADAGPGLRPVKRISRESR